MIESVLNRHPAVEESVVVAIPDDTIGHRLAAIVVVKHNAEMREADLQQHCLNILPRYMVPSVVEFRRNLPRTSSGKVDRQVLPSTLRRRAHRTGFPGR